MNNKSYVTYYRASTEKQRDGLGLEAQRASVRRFLDNYGGEVIEEVEEIISGASKARDGFDRALELCKQHGAILLVHRIDRLSRGGFVTMAKIQEEGIPYIEADSPHDSDISKSIKFLFAVEERKKTKMRVTDSLARIKENIERDGYHISKAGRRITSLGSPQNLSEKSRERSKVVRKAKAIANENNRKAYALASRMRDQGSTLKAIANYLNKHDFKTSRGNVFYPIQVSNLIKLYEE